MYSSGDIFVTKQGIYNSKLHAEGRVEVNGFVRGGELYAGRGAIIAESGGGGGSVTTICVSRHETISIKSVLGDTVIRIGGQSHTFTQNASDIHARLDSSGNLIF